MTWQRAPQVGKGSTESAEHSNQRHVLFDQTKLVFGRPNSPLFGRPNSRSRPNSLVDLTFAGNAKGKPSGGGGGAGGLALLHVETTPYLLENMMRVPS